MCWQCAGRLDDARAAIQQLLQCGGTTLAEIQTDTDLALLHGPA